MRTGAAEGHHGYFHEAVCYDSDDDLLAVAVPFLLDGVAAGEPTLVSLDQQKATLVRAALPADSGVSFLARDDVYSRPSATIRSLSRLLASCVARGVPQIRVLGEVPPPAVIGPTWDWWARYESVINHALHEYPVWGLCPYDTRITPGPVLDDVVRTHPHLATADGRHIRNDAYTDPQLYLSERRPVALDPLQLTPPIIELTDPSPAQARCAVYDADRGHLAADDIEDLVVAVSETVTNALRHGHPPVRFRLWSANDRIIVAVSDHGEGPKDPFVGLLPAASSSAGGRGLWITYQSCNHVALCYGSGAFTVRLTAGNPHSFG